MTLKNKLAALREESLRVTRAQQERYEEFKRQERARSQQPAAGGLALCRPQYFRIVRVG
jgi:hypothetical protein